MAVTAWAPGQVSGAQAPIVLTLGTLSLSSTNFTVTGTSSANIIGATAGSTITATSSDGTTLTVNAGTLSGSFTVAGSPSITLTETLAGATGSPKSTVVPVTVAGASSAVFMPTVASAPIDAYGPIKLISGYTGNVMRLRRGDNTEADFAANSGENGNLPDYDAILAWTTGPDPLVVRLYDQTVQQTPFLFGSAPYPLVVSRRAEFGNKGVPVVLGSGGTPYLMRAAVAADARRNLTRFVAIDNLNSIGGVFSYENGSQNQISFRPTGGDGTYQDSASTGGAVTFGTIANGFYQRLGRKVLGFTGSTTERRMFFNSGTLAGAANTVDQAAVTKRLGTALAAVSTKLLVWGDVSYPALSITDAQAVSSALQAIITPFTGTYDRMIVVIGDSIESGQGSNLTNPAAMALPSLNGAPELMNFGTSNSKLSTWNTNYATQQAQYYKSAYGSKNIYKIQAGTNDLAMDNLTSDQLYTIFTQLVAKAKATGYKVWATTILPRNDASWNSTREAERVAYNAKVIANTAGADRVDDIASISGLTNPDGPSYADKLHPNDIGGALIAQVYVTAINALMA